MIEIQNLKKEYLTKHARHVALKGINLKIQDGQVFGIIGKSGAGKSTLIRCINLLEAPSEGHILINGEDITKLSNEKLRKARQKIGMIFQHFNLLSSRTVYDNISFPLELQHVSKDKIHTKVNELLTLVGLDQKARSYPDELSGGQKQRVAIARALASEPVALLCDEATSALDPETTDQILTLLKRLNKELNLTIILITHEMDVIRKICDQVAIIDEGEIQETGTVTELFLSPKTAIAKSFTENSMHLKLPEEIQSKLYNDPYQAEHLSPVIKMTFLGDSITTPVIAELNSKFKVSCNIIQANIERIQAQSVGITICHMLGEKDNWEKALGFLHQQQIKIEVIGYATINAF
ncbi:methionine ABC transporter ATP-binding protein [Fastidiosibacter lacustris]|uniref:methionine ABC transporter ATP-binding protein n=1 Tax=Fastidiosibacter lacustris TaxID=2056695 RepID=UPI000E342769|nr:methionine ABC transporter ATP-binding protein [Fastidiosibacter lacustris]